MKRKSNYKKEVTALFSNIVVYTASFIIGMVLLALLARMDIFKNVEIYYYKMIGNAIISVAIIMMLLLISRKISSIHFLRLDLSTIFSTCALVGMAMLLFISIGPLTIDRSYTIFSLADMAENENRVFTEREIEDRFSSIYIYQYDSIEKRIQEQLSIGNIIKVENGYQISDKGKKLINTFRMVEKIYPVEDKRIIYPIYGDTRDEKN